MNVFYILFIFTTTISAYTAHEYTQAYAQDPSRYELLYNTGVEAARVGNYQQAYDYFASFTDRVTGHDAGAFSSSQLEQAWYNRGNAAFHLHEYQKAIDSFQQAVQHNPNNELASKKIEYLKQLLQKQEEEQQKKTNDNNEKKSHDPKQKDQRNNKNEKEESSENNQQQQPEEQKNKQKDEQQQSQSNDENKNEKKDENRQQSKEQEPSQHESEQQKGGQANPEEHNDEKQQTEHQKTASDTPQDVPLTDQEQYILAAMEELDQKMNAAMELQKLKKAQGSPHERNNW